LANQKQELPVAAMFVNGSEPNVQSLERTFYRFFFFDVFSSPRQRQWELLPSLGVCRLLSVNFSHFKGNTQSL
jgi:hypothetical protein